MTDPRLIHVGIPKAASTYLDGRGLPQLGLLSLKLQPADREAIWTPGPFDVSGFKNKIAAAAEENWALTDGALSGQWRLDEVAQDPLTLCVRIASRLRECFPNAKVLLITREQASFLLSMYAFRVCVWGHVFRSLEAFLRRYGEILVPRLRYDSLVLEYHRIFGPDNVLVLPMELLKSQEGRDDFFASLSGFLGLKPCQAPPMGRVNPSPRSIPLIRAMQALNLPLAVISRGLEFFGMAEARMAYRDRLFRLKKKKLMPRLQAALPDGPRLSMNPEWLAWVGERFGESNHRLGELAGRDLTETLGYQC